MKNFTKKSVDFLKNVFWKVSHPIKRFFENFKRSSKWFVRMWNNYDWESTYLIEMMVEKMKDMRYQFDVRDKHFINLRHQPVNFSEDCDEFTDLLKSLDEAIEVGERILKDDYLHYTPKVKKWFDENILVLNSEMPDDVKDEFIKCCEKEVKDQKKDRKKFFNIIRDNHELWWD